MKLLVVTPTLGQSPWLGETVDSVSVCAPDATHILVGPAVVGEELKARHPRTRFVAETPGGGMYAAINKAAASLADWDAISYLNDDDRLLLGFAALLACVRRHGNGSAPLLAYGRVRLIDTRGRRLGAIPVSRFPSVNRLLYAQQLEPVYQHGTVLTRAAWESLGGFDPAFRLCGDSELLARACLASIPTQYANSLVAAFRLRAGQLTQLRDAMRAERSAVDRKLGLPMPPSATGLKRARILFRLSNLAIYAERVARFGCKTFNETIEVAGRESPPPDQP